jgi:hypothetical protein
MSDGFVLHAAQALRLGLSLTYEELLHVVRVVDAPIQRRRRAEVVNTNLQSQQ